MSIRQQGKSNTFHYDVMVQGVRYRGSRRTLEEAQEIESALKRREFLHLNHADFRALLVQRDLLSTNVGSISELLVCAHALASGYDAFRTVSSHSGCDVVIISRLHRRPCRVEVKTLVRAVKGPSHHGTVKYQLSQHDVVAAVALNTCDVIFKPDLAGWFLAHGEPIPEEELTARPRKLVQKSTSPI